MTERMREEPNLFEARARTKDPATSHEAAVRVTRSGKLSVLGKKVLDCLKLHDGATCNELHFYMGDPDSAHKLMRNLCRSGYVKEGPVRKCLVKKTNAISWFYKEQTHEQRE